MRTDWRKAIYWEREAIVSQTRSGSFFESLGAALVAAPTAIGLHKLMLFVFGDCVLVNADCNDIFVLIAWIVFFFHSVSWKYVIRRVHNKYNTKLDPIYHIQRWIKK